MLMNVDFSLSLLSEAGEKAFSKQVFLSISVHLGKESNEI